MRRLGWIGTGWLIMTATAGVSGGGEGKQRPQLGPLDPQGKVHIPIGIADTLDTLKTFVEAEGCFSPGMGSYGVYLWLHDPAGGPDGKGRLFSPAMPGANCKHGLTPEGFLIPWGRWSAGPLDVRTEVCHVVAKTPGGVGHIVAARVGITNTGKADREAAVFAALRGLGPAGWPVRQLAAGELGDALLVDGHPALVAWSPPADGPLGGDAVPAGPSGAGVVATDTVGEFAARGELPPDKAAESRAGDCSGAIRWRLNVPPGKTATLAIICPVLPGRRAVGHQWDGTSQWAQADLAKPNPAEGGLLQPDPGLDFYRKLKPDELFDQAAAYWRDLIGRVKVSLPDPRWAQALAAITGHAAMTMNEGAPDVAVVNYNVFNRDGVYIANILQKAGRFDLAEAAIGYFLEHPFNGRAYPEADNPGQVLWVMGEHWFFTRDEKWLQRVYPSVRKLAALIEYYRTKPGPHWVCPDGLEFGDAIPAGRKRQKLESGRCDGQHPEYTEAFDVAGLWAAGRLADAAGQEQDAVSWGELVGQLHRQYDQRFGAKLRNGYGSYCVLWPCRLYPYGEGKAFEQFKGIGAQKPGGWRYFPLATAHQGLLAGSREAGWKTIDEHLKQPQMQGWYAFDEGGGSGSGGWQHLRTTWNGGVAMPHGWAIAELHLLIRDCLVFEDGELLALLAGVPEDWFTAAEGMAVENMPTRYGKLSFRWKPQEGGATLELTGKAEPNGFVLHLPPLKDLRVSVDGEAIRPRPVWGYVLPPGTRRVRIAFTPAK